MLSVVFRAYIRSDITVRHYSDNAYIKSDIGFKKLYHTRPKSRKFYIFTMSTEDNFNNSLSMTTSNELLRYLLERDNLSLDGVVNDMRKDKRKQIIDNHPYAIFQTKDGRWRSWLPDSEKKDGRRQIAKSSLDKLYDAIIDYYEVQEDGLRLSGITLEKLYPQWLEFKSLHTTADSYIYRIQTEWEKHYKGTSIIKRPIRELTKVELDEWAHRLILDNNMTRKQYYNTTMIMRQTLEYAVDLEIIDISPFSKVKIDAARMFRRVHKKSSSTQVYSKNELETLYDNAWDDFYSRKHHKHQLIPLAMMFMFQTGMRISEACVVRYEDILGDEILVQRMYLDYNGEIADRTKGFFGDRVIPLTSKAKELIEEARTRQQDEGVSDSGYIFSMTDEPVPYGELRKSFYKACKKLGFDPKSSHKARKTFISTLIDAGVNINTIREIAGHKDERTTYNSYCFDRSEKADRLAIIDHALSI